FDALLLAEGGAQLRAMAAAATVAGVGPPAVQLLGTGKWDEPGVGTEPALVGAWFAGPPPSGRDEFESRFKRVFGQAAPRLATLAYDATALAAVLGRGAQAQPFSEAALTDPNGFFGRDGLFRLNADGTAERRLAILRVERTGVAVIDEPPRSFAAGS
ncbi:MAG: penicillin-binding protein activator, partial [Rhizobiaceae bacterium]